MNTLRAFALSAFAAHFRMAQRVKFLELLPHLCVLKAECKTKKVMKEALVCFDAFIY